MKHLTDIREQASEWLIAFSEREVDAAAEQEFLQWLRSSPEHVAAYLRLSAIWECAGELRRQPGMDLSAVMERVRAEDTVKPPQAPPPRNTRTRVVWHRVAIAAGLLLAFGAILGRLMWTGAPPVYVTGAAEQRTVRLSDGSIVQLNARSRVEVHYREAERRIELLEGEALFSVTHDPRRPFVVQSEGTRVSAVGTQFDVNRVASNTIVTVAEGKVAISSGNPRRSPEPGELVPSAPAGQGAPALLVAGDQAIVRSGKPPEIHRADIPAATAWTEGKLLLDSTPLREAVERLNRAAPRRLVIEDESILDFHVSGVFPYADPVPLARFLQRRFGVVVEESRDVVRLRRPQPPDVH